ncbi:xylulokinase [Mycetocola lacteus]|uniref:Xylulose kinase n=1 Tax=Mycetocola lacteus TaxID=76637 RepID=A0A3L7AU13_9MICO|nr:xylulokinase [Mycetocola lacteus]RLP84003.1 xylulokinase [Mycetocola lacteus]
MSTLVAGVDSSTQSCKVVIRDLETGALIRSGRADHPAGTEVDPARWWDALCLAIADAGGLADVAALSVGGQQHGLVALDAEGRVIRDALLWNDTRSAQAALDLIAEIGAEAYAERTGILPVASITATKLRWLRDHEPENAARVAAVALPHDWLTWRLAGFGPEGESPRGPDLNALRTDRSDASGTGYWSATTESYDRDLLIAALGHDAILPVVLGPGESAGSTAAHADEIPAGIVLGPGAGDNAAAALGLGLEPGDVAISLGTSGTVFAHTSAGTADATGIVAGFADATGGHLPLVCTLNAARVLDVTARLLGVDHAELSRLALAAPAGADGLTLVPYFEGERTPNRPDATATLSGMTLGSTTREGLARAAVEGMLGALADGFDALVERSRITPTRVLLIGGAAQSEAVQRIAASIFTAPVLIPEPGEYVAAGATVQAAWALTGSRPTWPAAPAARVNGEALPELRTQYARAARRYTEKKEE